MHQNPYEILHDKSTSHLSDQKFHWLYAFQTINSCLLCFQQGSMQVKKIREKYFENMDRNYKIYCINSVCVNSSQRMHFTTWKIVISKKNGIFIFLINLIFVGWILSHWYKKLVKQINWDEEYEEKKYRMYGANLDVSWIA